MIDDRTQSFNGFLKLPAEQSGVRLLHGVIPRSAENTVSTSARTHLQAIA